MTGVSWGGPSLVQRLRDLLPHLGLDAEQLLIVSGDVPEHLRESHLEAWSYSPDFTPLVQHLLQLRRAGRCLSIAVCGPEAANAARAFTAAQLAVGFTEHGLRAVVVDADVGSPGLAGLISDPHQEGLVDMVRFGRSCRALLRTPVPGRPAVLGLGSFPVDGPAPFENEAWLGIVHRVSVHAEVALFVAPLHVQGDVNPLTQATDQVLYVPAVVATASTEQELEHLRRSAARVAAVVLCGAPAAAAAAPAAPTLPEIPIVPEVPEVPEIRLEPSVAPRVTPPPFPAPVSTPPEVPALQDFQPPPVWEEEEVARPAGKPEVLPAQPEATPDADVEPELVGAAAAASPPAADVVATVQAATRSAEEANQLRQQLHLDDADFSYSEGGRNSRLPLFLFLAIVLTIGGFLGWALWSQREINRRAQQILAGESEPGVEETQAEPAPRRQTRQAPDDAAAARSQSEAKPDDEAAATANVPPTPKPAVEQPVQPQLPPEPPAQPQLETPTSAGTPPAGEGVPTSTSAAEPAMVFAVHVASYRRLEQANQDIANLRKHGFEGRAVRTDLGSKGIWYRVYVGSYPTKEAASAARETIVKLPGYDAFAQVRRIAVP